METHGGFIIEVLFHGEGTGPSAFAMGCCIPLSSPVSHWKHDQLQALEFIYKASPFEY